MLNDCNSNNRLTENWSRWLPNAEGIDGNYYVKKLEEDLGDLKIILASEDSIKEIEIFFPGIVASYRSTYETFRASLINQLSIKYGDDFFNEWSFFKVEHDSEYVNWLEYQADGTIQRQYMIHFVILATESVIDIIAANEPQIQISQTKTNEVVYE